MEKNGLSETMGKYPKQAIDDFQERYKYAEKNFGHPFYTVKDSDRDPNGGMGVAAGALDNMDYDLKRKYPDLFNKTIGVDEK